MLSHFSCVWLFATPWTVAHQSPLSMGFSRREYESGLPFPPAGDLPDPGIEPLSLTSPALAGRLFITLQTGETNKNFPGQHLLINELTAWQLPFLPLDMWLLRSWQQPSGPQLQLHFQRRECHCSRSCDLLKVTQWYTANSRGKTRTLIFSSWILFSAWYTSVLQGLGGSRPMGSLLQSPCLLWGHFPPAPPPWSPSPQQSQRSLAGRLGGLGCHTAFLSTYFCLPHDLSFTKMFL